MKSVLPSRLLGAAAISWIALAGCSSSSSSYAAQSDSTSTPPAEMAGSISVDADKILKPVSRGLFGIHAAWVYDAEGLWDPDRNEVRPNVLRLAEELRPGPVRFPGGIGADFYHWRDGIGPRSSRPIRPHGSDKDKSRNGFGTDELMAFCSRTGAEPLLMVNILGGTPQEAADWVAYCNRPNNPERARNGSVEPYHVRYWEIGNEPYVIAYSEAQKKGQMSAQQYADLFLRYAAAMKQVDPSIRLLAASGTNFGTYRFLVDGSWNKTLLERAAGSIDYLSVHNAYTPVLIKKASFDEVYRAMLTFPEELKENFKTLNRQIDTYAPRDASRIKIAVTEWGPFFAPRQEEVYLDHSKTLGAALAVASIMQVFLNADRVEMANFFKFIDIAFQGMIGHDGVPKPSYYALQMYSRHFGDNLIASTTDGPTYDFPRQVGAVDPVHNAPYLVSVASLNTSGSKLYIVAVNKHFTNPIRTKIQIRGFHPATTATLWTLTAPSLDANNGPDLPNVRGIKWPKPAKAPHGSMFDAGRPGLVTTQMSKVDQVSDTFDLVIPPRAVVSLELDKQ